MCDILQEYTIYITQLCKSIQFISLLRQIKSIYVNSEQKCREIPK